VPHLPLSLKQIESLLESSTRVSIWSGAIRSGKTIASMLRWLIYLVTAPRGGQLVVGGPHAGFGSAQHVAPLTDPSPFGPVAEHMYYTVGAPTGRILDRTVYALGASDAKAEKALRGLTCCGAYIDELTVIAEDNVHSGSFADPSAASFRVPTPQRRRSHLSRRQRRRLWYPARLLAAGRAPAAGGQTGAPGSSPRPLATSGTTRPPPRARTARSRSPTMPLTPAATRHHHGEPLAPHARACRLRSARVGVGVLRRDLGSETLRSLT
jgi:hypothetical protein